MEALALYWFPLEVPPAALTEWRAWLSAEERARADRLIMPGHAGRYVAAHAQLRWLLAQRLGGAAVAVTFERGPQGKPHLPGRELEFNLSDSGGYGLVGLHRSMPLGVDIERERPDRDVVRLARRFFTPEEAVWLEALAPAARVHGFCRLWTCKEAWMKADGRGLQLGPRQTAVTLTAAGPRLGNGWFARELEIVAGYAAAVVLPQAPAGVTLARSPLAPPPAPAPPTSAPAPAQPAP
ncbi:MAG: 4'-phosphopantetheinyl transferase family protein [Terriglobales bacterium]